MHRHAARTHTHTHTPIPIPHCEVEGPVPVTTAQLLCCNGGALPSVDRCHMCGSDVHERKRHKRSMHAGVSRVTYSTPTYVSSGRAAHAQSRVTSLHNEDAVHTYMQQVLSMYSMSVYVHEVMCVYVLYAHFGLSVFLSVSERYTTVGGPPSCALLTSK